MSRISLKETYDNRSVIAQIAKVTDTAEDAAETVEQKAAEINDALTDVNAAVQAAEGAVTTANAASASAQQSAQTVAGYENRLGTVEGDVVQLNTDVEGVESDLNAVTLRVQTAEGQIATIQGRVTALETADGENVKLTGEHAIGNYAVLLTGTQGPISGAKSFSSLITIERTGIQPGLFMKRTDVHVGSETVNKGITYISWVDGDNVPLASLNVVMLPAGNARITVACRNTDGTLKELTLLTGDVI